jgi:hypothetical protein
MTKSKYDTIKEILNANMHSIDAEKCLEIFKDNVDRFLVAPGSKTKHQAWDGGYLDHLIEVMRIAIKMYDTLDKVRPLHFSLSDVLLVLFLHDLEKPFRYVEPFVLTGDLSDEDKFRFILSTAFQYGIKLSSDQKNAIKYIHGEGDDYSPTENVMGRLAAFCHCCDTISARIWFDYPKKDENIKATPIESIDLPPDLEQYVEEIQLMHKKVHNELGIPSEKLSYSISSEGIPRYVRIGDPDKGTALRLTYHKHMSDEEFLKEENVNLKELEYYRDAGCWEVGVQEIDGKLVSKSHMKWLDKQPLFPISRRVYLDENEGYV